MLSLSGPPNPGPVETKGTVGMRVKTLLLSASLLRLEGGRVRLGLCATAAFIVPGNSDSNTVINPSSYLNACSEIDAARSELDAHRALYRRTASLYRSSQLLLFRRGRPGLSTTSCDVSFPETAKSIATSIP